MRQFLLPPGELLQFLQRLVDGALPLVCGLRHPAALVLVLLGVQLQVEQPFEVARGAITATPAATAPAAAAKCHLDVAESSFRAQQVLQRFLLRRQSVLPFGALQLVGGRPHGRYGLVHIVDEALKRVARALNLAGLHPLGKRFRLVAQFPEIASSSARRAAPR